VPDKEWRETIMPRVCIVIVNWNGRDLVMNALQSVLQINYKDYAVVVIDNASTDGSVEAIRKNFPEVTIIVNEKNLGGTGGFNTGIRYALTQPYEYIWLLDNDAIVDRDSLSYLVEAMEKDSKIGIAGSKILQQENPSLIWETGVKMDWIHNKRILINHNIKDSSNTNNIYEVDHVAACSLLARTSCLSGVGLMDENYFWGLDDIDWCLSFKKFGYKVVAVSESRIWHPNFDEKGKGEMTKRDYMMTRNWLYLVRKHTYGLRKMVCLHKALSDIIRRLIMFRFNKDTNADKIISMAVKDFLRGKFGEIGDDYDRDMPVKIRLGSEPEKNILEIKKNSFKKILIYPSISISKAKEIIKIVKRDLPDAKIHFLVEDDRKYSIADTDIDAIITFSGTGKSKIMKLMELKKNNYDLGLCNLKTFSDLGIAERLAKYDGNQFYGIEKDNFSIELMNVVLSIILGEIISLFFLPFCLSGKACARKT
jgi:GT2 family glycosyltransferase